MSFARAFFGALFGGWSGLALFLAWLGPPAPFLPVAGAVAAAGGVWLLGGWVR